ncbi:ATP-binding protein [Rhodococcus sp. NPDC003348]
MVGQARTLRNPAAHVRRTRVGRQNTDRILRMFARFISVGYVAYLIVLIPSVLALQPRMASWWTPVAVVTVFGSGLLPGLLSFRRDTRSMRNAAGVAAGLFLLAAFSWPLAWQGPQIPASDGVWLAFFPGLASLAAIVACPTAVAFAHLVIGCVCVQLINQVARAGAPAEMLLPEITFAIMFCTLFVGGAAMALRTGRVLDATTDETHAAAAAAAAQRARAVERERFDALIHDSVIATLLSAARGQRPAVVNRLATATLQDLDSLRSEFEADRPFTVDEAVSRLRAAAADADDGAVFTVARGRAGTTVVAGEALARFAAAPDDGAAGFADVTVRELDAVPADAVRAMGAALGEALRNSRLHAADSTRSVAVTVTAHGVKALVADDGAGFDRTAVAPHRLGVTVSILARMRQTPGGAARIESRPGAGTRVYLSWEAE